MRKLIEKDGILYLGIRGENLALQICIPIAEWIATYGDGTFQLIAQRKGDAAPYPVNIASDAEYVYWNVSSADTAFVGEGKAELQYYVGDTLAKSQAWQTRVTESLDAPGSPPPPYESWVEGVLQAGTDARNASVDAQAARDESVDAAARAEDAARRAEAAAGDLQIGNGLKWNGDTLEVDTSSTVQAGDQRPITSAAVQVEVGNIDALLQTI